VLIGSVMIVVIEVAAFEAFSDGAAKCADTRQSSASQESSHLLCAWILRNADGASLPFVTKSPVGSP